MREKLCLVMGLISQWLHNRVRPRREISEGEYLLVTLCLRGSAYDGINSNTLVSEDILV